MHGHAFAVVRSAGNSLYNYENPVFRDVVPHGMPYQRSWRHRVRFTRLHSSQSGARVSVWNTFDFDFDTTASIINFVVLKDEEKNTDTRDIFKSRVPLPVGLRPHHIACKYWHALSTHHRITIGRVVSTLSAHRAVLLRLTRLPVAECSATFPGVTSATIPTAASGITYR